MASDTAYRGVSSCSAACQLCDLGKSLNLSRFSHLGCATELIIASNHRAVVRVQCVSYT